jgi:hypothetical protein
MRVRESLGERSSLEIAASNYIYIYILKRILINCNILVFNFYLSHDTSRFLIASCRSDI